VNPSIPICSRARDKTGICKELVLNSPKPDRALKSITNFFGIPGGTVYIIAHNGARFDRKVLKYRIVKFNYSTDAKNVDFIDSMNIFKLFKSQMPVSEKNRRLYNN
jgi:DNA polymerase III alpha subunit (gram-positive type)